MRWYLNVNGQQMGPLDEAAVVEMIRSGQVREAWICVEGGSQWQALGAHPPFAQALAGGAPPPPTPPIPAPAGAGGPQGQQGMGGPQGQQGMGGPQGQQGMGGPGGPGMGGPGGPGGPGMGGPGGPGQQGMGGPGGPGMGGPGGPGMGGPGGPGMGGPGGPGQQGMGGPGGPGMGGPGGFGQQGMGGPGMGGPGGPGQQGMGGPGGPGMGGPGQQGMGGPGQQGMGGPGMGGPGGPGMGGPGMAGGFGGAMAATGVWSVGGIFKRIPKMFNPQAYWGEIGPAPGDLKSVLIPSVIMLALFSGATQLLGTMFAGFSLLRFMPGTMIIALLVGLILQAIIVVGEWLILSLLINVFAGTFNTQKNPDAARKVAFGALFPLWVTSWLTLIPVPILGLVFALAGLGYGCVLMYHGLQAVMGTPKDKAIGYTAATMSISLVIVVGLTFLAACPLGCVKACAIEKIRTRMRIRRYLRRRMGAVPKVQPKKARPQPKAVRPRPERRDNAAAPATVSVAPTSFGRALPLRVLALPGSA